MRLIKRYDALGAVARGYRHLAFKIIGGEREPNDSVKAEDATSPAKPANRTETAPVRYVAKVRPE